MKHRLFIACEIPDNIKEEMLKIRLSDSYKTTKKDNLHITLLFLGDTDDSMIPEIKNSLAGCLKEIKQFDTEITTVGQFPEKGMARIIFLTGDKGCNELTNLAERVRENMGLLGFHDNKPFRFHITIGRLNENCNFKDSSFQKEKPLKMGFSIDKVTLYKSELNSNGALYSKLSEYKLK